MRLENLLKAQVQRLPQKIALVEGSERHTFQALEERVARVAGALDAAGLRAGDRFVLYLGNGSAFVELVYAVLTLGGIVVPVSTRLTASELKHICEDSSPWGIAFQAAQADIVDSITLNTAIIPIIVGGEHKNAVSYERLLQNDRLAQVPDLPPENDAAIIMYTSGTTGKAKGVVNTHANLVIQSRLIQAVDWNLSAQDVILATTPLAHRFGFARIANAISLGATLVILPRFEPQATIEIIAKERVTLLGMVPTVIRMMLPFIEADPSKFASVTRIVATGEAFPVELKRRITGLLPHVKFISFFGQTEAGGVTNLGHDEQLSHADSVGRPIAGVEVRIVNDADQPLPVGEVGELLVRAGPPGSFTTMREYYGRPSETAATIVNGWIRTGDMARLDEEGYLYIVDRKKDMIISGGLNIYTKEVESVLLSYPGIVDAAVVGEPDPVYGEAVIAFVEVEPGREFSSELAIEHCRSLIAGYKRPKRIVVVDSLPRNSMGKVLKRELQSLPAIFAKSPA